ncbi:MAG: sporulation transcriptional regulator SpoIIID [Clostridia bacterium]|nr:sporulation transcriptional regulator SpoIIID [Clostridia bacterium]
MKSVIVRRSLMDAIRERVETLGRYICDTHATVRETAGKFGISKSTVHKDMTQKLPEYNAALSAAVRSVLEENKAERHLRGGEATRLKYERIRQKTEDERRDELR